MNKFALVFLSGWLLLTSLLLAACSDEPVSPESQLRAWLLQMERAIEEKDLSTIRQLVSDDYQDDAGNTKQQAMLKLMALFKHYENIAISPSVTEIDVKEGFARLVVDTQFSQSTAFAELGLAGNTYQFVLLFSPDGDDWRLNQLSYQAK
ncbi:hypothetical protein [Ostreibacterium oceani]|uniref:DUF4440 domain-containing protein n=1 Tax=Ostreibacterium oceani TaxID=2654998 RepID=A0A6N7EUN3_9GAMM|nr:hypothetical protein [Ostreibacterium oceani]MPV85139.1 hypothetical protein [Ostreibacterium oceani]